MNTHVNTCSLCLGLDDDVKPTGNVHGQQPETQAHLLQDMATIKKRISALQTQITDALRPALHTVEEERARERAALWGADFDATGHDQLVRARPTNRGKAKKGVKNEVVYVMTTSD